MSFGSNYDWCDTDDTLARYDYYKSSTLNEAQTCRLPPYLQFHAPPPVLFYNPPLLSRSPEMQLALHLEQQCQQTHRHNQGDHHPFQNIQQVAPRLLAGSNTSSVISLNSSTKSGTTPSTSVPTPLPPYKTVICRAFYAKGKCFRAEPDKCEQQVPSSRFQLQKQQYCVQQQLQQLAMPPKPSPPTPKAAKKPPAPAQAAQAAPAALASLALADPRLYKTEMCRFFEATGGLCRFGALCTFAHGASELRRRRDETTTPTTATATSSKFLQYLGE
ncbi:hypothetical protein BDR26DRAFT_1008072 [Obelidium mucronatum]|nr:hypothetical protein BDR26DRAFT_1008072 [Obelidium mucronatum]